MRAHAPSATARLVALGVLLRRYDAELARHILPATAALMTAGLDADRSRFSWMAKLLRYAWMRFLLLRLEAWSLPRLSAHYVQRKRAVKILADAALQAGARRVVILGAGLDGLGYALATTRPDIQIIECDHPATQSIKRAALQASPVWPANLDLCALDLGDSEALARFQETLLGPAEVSTLVVAEGLAMYLAPQRARRLLGALGRIASVEHLLFSYLDRPSPGHIGFLQARPWTRRWLARQSEPFRWSVSAADMQRALTLCGYATVATCNAERNFGPPDLPNLAAPGEALCYARRCVPRPAVVATAGEAMASSR